MSESTKCSYTCALITVALVVAIGAVVYHMIQVRSKANIAAAIEAEHFYAEAAESQQQLTSKSNIVSAPMPQLMDFTTNVDEHEHNGPAPLSYHMGSLDGIRLKTGCPDGWRHPPCGPRFKNTTQNLTVHGHHLPLNTPTTVNDFPDAPPVDGKKNSPKSLFMFAYNQSSPACCPSTYSSDKGCVCTTHEQRRWLESGGSSNRDPTLSATQI
jgi:hypothetical protein